MRARVYVCGRTCVEAPGGFYDESAFPARQGRLAWTYLVLERHRTVTREQLSGAIWGEEAPIGSDRALSAILSKLRALMIRADLAGCAIQAIGSGLRLVFPADIWIDWEAAYADVERATHLCAEENVRGAYGWALATYMIAREDLLPGELAPWLVPRREELQALVRRSIDLLIGIYRATGNLDMAVQFAEEAIDRDPLREASYRRLLELYAEIGNPSALMRTYRRCRETFETELGRNPSDATEAAYLRALDAGARGT